MVSSTKLAKGVNNKDLKVMSAPLRKVPDGLFQTPFLVTCVGSRGMGKTNAVINMIMSYIDAKCFDTIYLLTKTVEYEPKYKLLTDYAEQHHVEILTYDHYDHEIFNEMIKDINEKIEEWEKFEYYKKTTWPKWCKCNNENDMERLLDELDLSLLFEFHYLPPHCRFKRYPEALMFYDDFAFHPLIYPAIPRNNPLSQYTILHRHRRVSILHGVQSFFNCITKSLRGNMSGLMLFLCRDPDAKKVIAKECSNTTDPDDMVMLWDYACGKPEDHCFFKIDFGSPKFRYMRNFDEILSLPEVKKNLTVEQK